MEEVNETAQGSKLSDLIRACVAELVGMTLFVFVGTMSVQTGDLTSIALCHGLTIAVLVAGLGHIR